MSSKILVLAATEVKVQAEMRMKLTRSRFWAILLFRIKEKVCLVTMYRPIKLKSIIKHSK